MDQSLQKLVELHCLGQLTEEQAAQLHQRICSDVEARRFFVAYLDMHARLLWRFGLQGSGIASELPFDLVAASESAPVGHTATSENCITCTPPSRHDSQPSLERHRYARFTRRLNS
jgi:hypothetical protein